MQTEDATLRDAALGVRKKPRRHAASVAVPASPAMPTLNLFQIAYSDATLAEVEPGYRILDNRGNARPDWYEYWPIRNFLLSEILDESAFYGFFSTKFGRKTNLVHAEVVAFAGQRAAAGADVILFSPQPDMGAFFLNVFEQGELFDPGLVDAYGAFLEHIGRPTPLGDLVMDMRHVVFSNYFIARPAFWREWLSVNEAMFAVCEGPDCELKRRLCQPTTYPGAAERKIFLQERVASLLLATQPQWRSAAYNPFGMGWSASKFRDHPHEAYISDALKLAFGEQRFPQYMTAFAAVRDRLRIGGAETSLLREPFAPGHVIAVRHSAWSGALVADSEPFRLHHAVHRSMASYRLYDDLLLVKWDDYDPEVFVRHGDEYRLSSFDRDRRGLDPRAEAWTTIADARLGIESICVALPDGMGSAHVRPGTSDVLVLEAACLRRDYDVPSMVETCDIIVDLGANTGLASIFFAHRFPQATVVAVEPARDNCRLLRMNAQTRPSIIPVESAVAPRDGMLDLQDSVVSGERMQAWAYRTVDRESGLGSYMVEALSIPTLMRRYGLGFIDILKIDIKGAEFGLFSEETETWLPKVRMILIKTHERFVPGIDALLSCVLAMQFEERPPEGECRVFVRR